MPLFFYIFALLTILGSVGVISSRNPVYSVLWLIFTFINTAGLCLLLKAEFVGMMIIVVYVGAVAVLFLFTVMMINFDPLKIKHDLSTHPILSGLALSVLTIDLIILIGLSLGRGNLSGIENLINQEKSMSLNNTQGIGELLYTEYFVAFQMSGIVLLIAMVGCIVLTLRQREGVKKQILSEQLLRRRSMSIELVKVEKGKGIDGIDYR